MKLGEFLVQSRRISPGQLTEALSAQLIYGGHLGTCMIERGDIDERTLGQALSVIFGVAYAEPESLEQVPKYAIDLLPVRLIEKHTVVPFCFENKTLHVAMIDPRDLSAIDELSFAAGCRIDPRVAPEVRLFQSMERYYGIPRRQRYVLLSRQLDGEAKIDLTYGHSGLDQQETLSRGTVRVEAIPRVQSPNIAADTDAESQALGSRLVAAGRLDEIADALIDTICHRTANVVLFRVKSGAIEFWRASRGVVLPAASRARFPLISEPFFSLLRGEDHYRGGIPDGAEFQNVHRTLGIGNPFEFLLAPIYVEDRLFGFFYADGGATPIPVPTSSCRRWVTKLGIALHLLLLKRRILAA